MDDVESGSREELRLRVPRHAQERRVHALELAVETDDGQRVDREVEELLQLGLGLRHMRRAGQVDALLSLPRLSRLGPSEREAHGAGYSFPISTDRQLLSKSPGLAGMS